MTRYVQDVEEKLEEIRDFYDRTLLFLDNINARYRQKRVAIDRKRGFVAVREDDEELPLDSLSSGEDREFVLHYDLLFRVPANTLVLIDEPELSLHVAWQKRFLPDLLKIIGLSGFDALVATHSPYITGERDDLMVGLGDSQLNADSGLL